MLSATDASSSYTTRTIGKPGTLEYRVYLERDGKPISPFHDIPLFANKEHTVLNMIVEIPRWTTAKYEISRNERYNPIKQDVKNGKPRYANNCFPYKGYVWNYGAIPQTWEDSGFVHPDTSAHGDNDPLDACEIGRAVAHTGQVKQVKVLGTICLLDGGETDWKIIVIDITDPLADRLHDIEDVEEHMPGLLDATRDWFRVYKVPDGKPANGFAMHGAFRGKAYADGIIEECSGAWKRLILGKASHDGISVSNSSVPESPAYHKEGTLDLPVQDGHKLSPEPEPETWFFIPRDRL